MSSSPRTRVHPTVPAQLLRATLFHTPYNPFLTEGALQTFSDGGLVIAEGRVLACGNYVALQAQYPQAVVRDLRGGFLLPGLVDTHIHYPQVRILGSLGLSLLDWLQQCALPEETRLGNEEYAHTVAKEFVLALAAHGTTTSLVFGAHFPAATSALFDAAGRIGLRMVSGLVVADRLLRPDLHQTPEAAYDASKELIRKFHGKGLLLYAVTPRFALSASEAMLEVCQTLMREHTDVRFQTHLNEHPQEVAEVLKLFPWAKDYLAVYERFGLIEERSVLAHNLHPTDGELQRLSESKATVSHCPCSNAALGSGWFPLRRHIEAGVRCAMGTDVGAGTGFGLLKEGLQAYMMQRLAPEGFPLGPAHLLYLATRAGAEALGLETKIGDFQPGKAADFVYLRPPRHSPLAVVSAHANSPEHLLAALFTLAGAESVCEVCVEGVPVYSRDHDN
ncbi:MAG TPA: guanine deaminase [Verrucomicrobiae bacterium]|jgi:guanine deaminase|nr:guanine deaminase [Verrucomicrobiae bacterium]